MPNSPDTTPTLSERAAQANLISDVVVAGVVWANERAKNDPTWPHKQHLVSDAIAADIALNGFPLSQVATIALVDRAFLRVNTLLASLGL